MRHALLHLLFPDHFERIVSRRDKNQIINAFGGLLKPGAGHDPDQSLYAIRQELTALLPDQALDFYWPPLAHAWYTEDSPAEGMATLEALRFKRQVVLYGPPGTGKTHRAAVMAERVIRAEALRRWGAWRYFTEEEAVQRAVRDNIRRLQLHPAYSYEDFIRGLHYINGQTVYQLGFLPRLVEDIEKQPADDRLPFVLILDEMNRADQAIHGALVLS